jgi:hypothetical protein
MSSLAPQKGSYLVLERLSSALACTAALSGASATASFIDQAVLMLVNALSARDEVSLLGALRLLTGLAVEVERLEWTRKQMLVHAFQGRVLKVVCVLQDILVAGESCTDWPRWPLSLALSELLKVKSRSGL